MAPKMKVIFRADASLQMGTGHVMRCLTLADALTSRGAECQFICREHPGNLIEHIRQKGYRVHALATASSVVTSFIKMNDSTTRPQLAHASWLDATQEQDATECATAVAELQPDWLIVDHYALDAHWEIALKPHYRKLMVIDDLADRPHVSDLLLDQTFDRDPQAYQPWVSASCTVLCGSQYALLRPEFAALRPYSLKRRENPQFEHLLITMGGVDKDNATGQVLQGLKTSELPANCRITVVMGASAPWIAEVRRQAEQLPWPTEVQVNVSDMAQLMADSDLAIGAAGSTAWERCCLGLPTAMVVLADNQRTIAQALQSNGASIIIDGLSPGGAIHTLLTELASNTQNLERMSGAARRLADGLGTTRLVSYLFA